MEESIKVIVFRMNDQRYGVDVQEVISIEKLHHVTEVPQTSEFIKGVINLRGEIAPVIDLKERLALGQTAYADQSRYLIVSINDIKVSLMVDEATDVMDINKDAVEPAPEVISGVNKPFLRGVAKLEDELLVLLDVEHILNFDELNEVKEVVEEEVQDNGENTGNR
ncbi:chemotaxis protein CheW [Virgibacillus doumboii]|uniref:chemotaxis protein CheW n=1 Tax=Virgibacillus doumboii TaxID=2697503 RepID=UPI0013E0B6C9|nr:chemotaxis protein CheW [Virgibacillus doumboii]